MRPVHHAHGPPADREVAFARHDQEPDIDVRNEVAPGQALQVGTCVDGIHAADDNVGLLQRLDRALIRDHIRHALEPN